MKRTPYSKFLNSWTSNYFCCVAVLLQVKDKFCLDYNEEEAVQHLQNLIDISVTAVMAVFVERMHKFAQYWRK